MTDDRLEAHSVGEMFFYLMATPCERCGRGPLRAERKQALGEGDRPGARIEAACGRCDHRREFVFGLPTDARLEGGDDAPPVVNPTDEPSRILDVGQWIMLFQVVLEAADRAGDKSEARRLGLEAAMCLEEALKFYEDNDLPPGSALRVESSVSRFRSHPEQFSRERLSGLRAKLPSPVVMREALSGGKRARRRFWKRG